MISMTVDEGQGGVQGVSACDVVDRFPLLFSLDWLVPASR
jgi:hypothetical protein